VLSRFSHGRERYVAYFQQAFLEHVLEGSVVYHGLAGHFFLRGVDHALKVRIIADQADRVRLEVEREGIEPAEALRVLQKDDEERRRWSMALYGIDTADASLYDLVIHVRKITVDDAVEIICHTAGLPDFQRTKESQAALKGLLLAARVKSAIVKVYPTAEVSAEDGIAEVRVAGSLAHEPEIADEIHELCRDVPDLRELRAGVRPRFGLIGRF
jgi:cytidylate kinase